MAVAEAPAAVVEAPVTVEAEPVAEAKPRRRRARVVAKPADEVDFQTAPIAEPMPEVKAVTKPRRRTRVVAKPAADEVDFQIAPIAEPVPESKPRRMDAGCGKAEGGDRGGGSGRRG